MCVCVCARVLASITVYAFDRGCLFACMRHACFVRKSLCPCARAYGVHACNVHVRACARASSFGCEYTPLFLRANGSRPARPFGRVPLEDPQAPTLPSMHATANELRVEAISLTPTPVHIVAVPAGIEPPSAHTPHHASARAGWGPRHHRSTRTHHIAREWRPGRAQ